MSNNPKPYGNNHTYTFERCILVYQEIEVSDVYDFYEAARFVQEQQATLPTFATKEMDVTDHKEELRDFQCIASSDPEAEIQPELELVGGV